MLTPDDRKVLKVIPDLTYISFDQHFSSSEPCLSAYQAPVDPSTVLGGFTGTNYSQVLYGFESHVDSGC